MSFPPTRGDPPPGGEERSAQPSEGDAQSSSLLDVARGLPPKALIGYGRVKDRGAAQIRLRSGARRWAPWCVEYVERWG